MAIDNQFGKGIGLAAGFDLGAQKPLDSRVAVNTIEERDAHVTENRAYEGMIVFVDADKKNYQLINGEWVELVDVEGIQDAIDAAIEAAADNQELIDSEQDRRLGILEGLVVGGEGEGLSAVIADVAANKTAIETLNGGEDVEGSVAKAVADAVNSVQGEVDAAEGRLDALEELVGKPAEGDVEASGLHADVAANAAAIEVVNGAVATEKERAELKEQELQNAIDAITAAETGILDQAKADATQKDTVLENKINGELDTIKGEIDLLQENDGKQDTAILELQNKVKAIQDGDVELNLNQVNSAIKDLQAADETLQGNIDNVDDKVDSAQEDLDALEALVGNKAVENGAAASGLCADVAANAAAVAAEASRADAEEKRIVGLVEAEAGAREAADNALSGRIAAFEGDAEKVGSVANQVKVAQEAVQANVDSLEDRVEANEGKLAGLEKDTVQAAIDQAEADAKAHAEQKIADLVNSAPEDLNTLKELADAIAEHGTVVDGYVSTINQSIATAKQEAIDDAAEDAASKDAALKAELQKEIDDDVDVVAKAVSAEAERAAGEEARIEGLVTTEKGRAEGQEAAIRQELANAIAKEVEDRDAAILVEQQRAEAEEAAIRGAFANADTALENRLNQKIADDIAAESALRQAEEADIRADFAAADSALKTELQAEIDSDVNVEKLRAEGAEAGLAGRLDVIEGEGEGSIKKAVADLAAIHDKEMDDVEGRIADLEAKFDGESSVNALIEAVDDKVDQEIEDREAADTELSNRIAAFEGDANKEGSVANQIKAAIDDEVIARNAAIDSAKNEVQGNVDDAVDRIEALEGQVGKDVEGENPATGLFLEVDQAKAAADAAQSAANAAQNAANAAQADADALEGRLDNEGGLVDRIEAVEDFVDKHDHTAMEQNIADNAKAIDELEAFVAGHDHKVMQDAIQDNADAIAIINGTAAVEGSIANAVAAEADARNTAIAAALEAYATEAEMLTLIGNVVNSLALSMENDQMILKLGGVDGVAIHSTTLNMATDEDIDAIIAELDEEENGEEPQA